MIMKIERKDLPKAQVQLLVELPTEEVQGFVAQAAQKISQDVAIPGFRRGHVPFDVLKKNVGEVTIYEEAFQRAVEKTLPEALSQEKITIVGQPYVEPQKIAPKNPFIYKAVVSVYPEVKLSKYQGLNISKKDITVDEKEIEKTMNDLRRMRASEKVVNRPAQKGDKLLIDFDILQNNVVVENGSYKKQEIELGLEHFVPGFEDNLIGLSKNAEKEFSVQFPKEYHHKQLAGRQATSKVRVHDVYEITLPEENDAWAKQLGSFNSLADLRKALAENLKKESESKEEQRLEREILEKVVENTRFGDLPEILLISETEKMIHELEEGITGQGGEFNKYLESIKKSKADIEKDFRPQAERRVKAALVIRQIALAEGINTTEEEIEREQATLQKYYEQVKPDLVKVTQTQQYKQYIGNILNNRKVMQFLVEKNTAVKK